MRPVNVDRMRRYRQRTQTPHHTITSTQDGGEYTVTCRCGWTGTERTERLASVAWGCHLIANAWDHR